MTSPTDPIRDPELTLTLDRQAVTATGAFIDAFLTLSAGDPKLVSARPHIERFRENLRAALQEDPPVRRYSLEEISERLLGENVGQVQRAAGRAAFLDRNPDLDWDALDDVQRMSWEGNALAGVEAALATAFDGATHQESEVARTAEPVIRHAPDSKVEALGPNGPGDTANSTPTQPSLSDLRERIRTERDSWTAAPPGFARQGALEALKGLLAYIEGSKDEQ